jgi:bifunctional DNase/RNase
MIVEMRIGSLLIDPSTGLPIVVLVESEGRRAVPIVIGMAEAEAIALALQQTLVPRPRTHDLLRDVLTALGGRLERIVIHDLRESTFYALLYIRKNGTVVEVDSRPSDAMALACRTGAQIFVEEAVLEQARLRQNEESSSEGGAASEEDDDAAPVAIDAESSSEELEELLASLKPEHFGKYKM